MSLSPAESKLRVSFDGWALMAAAFLVSIGVVVWALFEKLPLRP